MAAVDLGMYSSLRAKQLLDVLLWLAHFLFSASILPKLPFQGSSRKLIVTSKFDLWSWESIYWEISPCNLVTCFNHLPVPFR